jgi:hypothetical protein
MQSQVSGLVHHPLNSVLPTLLVTTIMIIVRSLKKPKAAAHSADPVSAGQN